MGHSVCFLYADKESKRVKGDSKIFIRNQYDFLNGDLLLINEITVT